MGKPAGKFYGKGPRWQLGDVDPSKTSWSKTSRQRAHKKGSCTTNTHINTTSSTKSSYPPNSASIPISTSKPKLVISDVK